VTTIDDRSTDHFGHPKIFRRVRRRRRVVDHCPSCTR